MKILIADDLPELRGIFKNHVEDLGYQGLEAMDGEEAIEILNQSFKDIILIILDLNMPRVDGPTALKRIKLDSRFNQIPVIICSAILDNAMIQEVFRLGAKDYLKKPFTLETLDEKIKSAIEKK